MLDICSTQVKASVTQNGSMWSKRKLKTELKEAFCLDGQLEEEQSAETEEQSDRMRLCGWWYHRSEGENGFRRKS